MKHRSIVRDGRASPGSREPARRAPRAGLGRDIGEPGDNGVLMFGTMLAAAGGVAGFMPGAANPEVYAVYP